MAMDQGHVHGAGVSIETYPGPCDRLSVTRPQVFPPDPCGGDYHEWNDERKLDALYRLSCIRYLTYLEDRALAATEADQWVQHYIHYLAGEGFTVAGRDVGETIGARVRWGAKLINSRPNPEWLFTGDAKVVEVDIEFGHGYRDVWYKLGYAEYEEMPDLQGQIK